MDALIFCQVYLTQFIVLDLSMEEHFFAKQMVFFNAANRETTIQAFKFKMCINTYEEKTFYCVILNHKKVSM